MFLLQDPLKKIFCHLSFWVCHNLSSPVLSQLDILVFFFFTILVLSFDFFYKLSCVTFWVLSHFKFCHNLSFVTTYILSQFEFGQNLCSWVFFLLLTIWVFEFCHNLNFCLLSKFGFWVSSQFEFFITRFWVS